MLQKEYIHVEQKELANGVISYECKIRKYKSCKGKYQMKTNRLEEIIDELNIHTHTLRTVK